MALVLRFLEILPQQWPRILAEEGALDPAERRNRLLEQQAAAWRRSPPRDPVIAAGLIGGIPAMTELLSLVAALDQGAVILPGLDRDRDAAEWAAIEEDEAHPQHLMAGLLRALDLTPAEVRDWPQAGRTPSPPAASRASPIFPCLLLCPAVRERVPSGTVRTQLRAGCGWSPRRCGRRSPPMRGAACPPQPADTLDGVEPLRLRQRAGGGGDDRAAAAPQARDAGRHRRARHPRSRARPPGCRRAAPLGHRHRRFGRSAAEPHAARRLSAPRPRSRRQPARPGAAARRAEASARRRRARPGRLPRSRPSARTGDPRTAPGSGLCRPQGGARRREHRFARGLSTGSRPASARLPELLVADAVPLVASCGGAYRGGRAARRDRDGNRRRAPLARGGGRGGGALLPRADRCRARLSAAARPALSGAVRGAGRRCGRAPGLRPASPAGDLGSPRSAAAAGRSARSRRAERGQLAGFGRARPVDVAADAARVRHRRAGARDRHRRA